MPLEKKPGNLKSRPAERGAPAERRRNERRGSDGRRHMDGVNPYAAHSVFNAHEACQYMGVSRPTLIRLITGGKIRAQKIGRGWRILRAEIDRFLRGG
jgi:excisionase family DNA binding protein